jgi:hypothetical protein
MRIWWRLHSLILVTYGLVAVYLTWPMAATFTTHLVGHPLGDSYEYIRHIWWLREALRTGEPLTFHPLLAYPQGLPGMLLWSIPLQTLPASLLSFVFPLPAAFNLTLILYLTLNGWSAFILIRHLTQDTVAAWLGGLVFMAYPTFQGHIGAGHIGLLALFGVPLYAYVLLRLREAETGRWRWMGMGALCFWLSTLGSTLIALYMLLPLTVFLLLPALWEQRWRDLVSMLVAITMGLVLTLGLVLPALGELRSGVRPETDIRYSTEPLALLAPSFQHPAYQALTYPDTAVGREPFEKLTYIGLVALPVVLVAVVRVGQSRGWLMLGGVSALFAWGPVLQVLGEPVVLGLSGYEAFITLPGALLPSLPLLNIGRTPARFSFTVALVVAVLVGYGWARIVKGRAVTVRIGLVALAAIFILWDYTTFWSADRPQMPMVSGIVPEPIAALGQDETVRAVFSVPWAHPLVDKEALFLQTGHSLPLIAGHIARETPVDPARLTILEHLNPAWLRAAGVDVVILHRQWADAAGELERRARSQLGEPVYADASYLVFRVPVMTESPFFAAVRPDMGSVDYQPVYVHVPEPGWIEVVVSPGGEMRQVVQLEDDGEMIQRWMLHPQVDYRLRLYLDQAGYHTLTLRLAEQCPQPLTPIARCPVLEAKVQVHIRNF